MKNEILYVDGYNMIGAWPNLKPLQRRNQIGDARDLLLDILSNYAKYTGIKIKLVFDAMFVPGITKRYEQYEVEVVFTKEGETADSYIEKAVGEENYILSNVFVATSDLAEQWTVFQRGAVRKSANELWKDIKEVDKRITLDTKTYQLANRRRNSPLKAKDQRALHRLYWDMVNRSQKK